MNQIPLSVLDGPRLKVERANSHIDHLISVTSPMSKDFYEISINKPGIVYPNSDPDAYELAFFPKKPIAETLALIIGDAVHNLRSSLDHLATGIVRAGSANEATTRQHFPFHQERENLVSHKDIPPIEKALPGSKDLIINQIQPHAGNLIFWGITRLDQIDKHNFILPVVSVANIQNIFMRMGNMVMQNCSGRQYADHPYVIASSTALITIEQNFYTASEIKFRQGTIFENQPVIPTLLQMSEVVSGAINLFADLISSKENA